ncbi:MAG: phosphatase PAP2 family protein [Bacteroidales bacterium]|nr:phosphatase PAP2 family protein [Bacteroidales bacterium]
MSDLLRKLNPFDIVIVAFCLLTGIYMLFGHARIDHLSIHILFRIITLIIIFLLIKTEDSRNKILHFVRNFYPLILLGFFYSETDYYNNLLFENFDPLLIQIENLLFGTQLSLELSQQIPFQWFSELMHFGYFSYYIITFAVPLLFYLKAPEQFEKTMFIIVLSFCIYYIIFVFFPAIGPQFYFPVEQRAVPNGFIFQKILNLILETGETQTGAFPSSHVGMAVLFLILIGKYYKKLLFTLVPLVIILIASTVYIKAHYAIDILAGLLTGILFYYLSNKIYYKYFNSTIENNVQ